MNSWLLLSVRSHRLLLSAAIFRRGRVQDQLVVAEKLVSRVLGDGWHVVATVPGAALVGATYRPPFSLVEISGAHRVVPGDFVTTEDGTGLVHIAPPFGEDDYRVGAANGLFDPTVASTLYNPVRPDGTFDDRVIGFAGEFVKGSETTRRLIDDLDRRGLLFREQPYEHAYPHCWRCDTPLIFRLSDDWFISVEEVRPKLLEENLRVEWVPEYMGKRMEDWLHNMGDWNISRRRYYGLPLPFYPCGCGHLNVIGSNFITKAEVDVVAVRRCEAIVVDSKDQARSERPRHGVGLPGSEHCLQGSRADGDVGICRGQPRS